MPSNFLASALPKLTPTPLNPARPLASLSRVPPAQAQVELTDEKKRKNLDQTIEDARMLVLREFKLLPVVEDSHPTLAALKDPDLKERVRRKTKEILIDDELRRRR